MPTLSPSIPPDEMRPAGQLDEVAQRIARARRSGRPQWLWPDVDPSTWRTALLDIERITRRLLASQSDELRMDARYDVPALGVAAYTSGMGPLLGYWIESGRLSAGEEAARTLALHLEHARRRMANLTNEAVAIAKRSQNDGIEFIILKGMHTAHGYFPEPGTRPVADIDLLVDAPQLHSFQQVLRAFDYHENRSQPRLGRADWLKGSGPALPRSLTLAHADDALSLDVHNTLDRNVFGIATVHLQALLQPSRTTAWQAMPNAAVLHEPLLTLFLAVHASEGLQSLRLIRQVELALVIQAGLARGELHWDELCDAAAAAGALRFAYPAMALTGNLVPDLIPSSVLQRFAAAATPAMHRVIGSLTPATAQRIDRVSIEERVMWAATPWERIRRVLQTLWPASAGNSLKRLAEIYAMRAWSVLRGGVTRG